MKLELILIKVGYVSGLVLLLTKDQAFTMQSLAALPKI